MSQNLKLTVSNSQLLPNLHTVPPADDKNIIKKVMSLNCGEIETKRKIKIDQKAFNVKLSKYRTMLKKFEDICDDLRTNFESMKNCQMHLLADNDELKFEELDTTVKHIIEERFAIKYPELASSFEKDQKKHQQYVSNVKTSISSITNPTFEHTKLQLEIKKAFEYVSKMFDVNMKYRFWVEMIIQPNEFHDLDDVQKYLIQNMIDKQQTSEKFDLNDFHSILINISNEFNKVHNSEISKENIIKEIEEFKEKELEMNMKIKNLEAENEKLKVAELEHIKQQKILLEELAFRNKKLVNAKSYFALLAREKKDLISIIEKMEVKEENFYSLQKLIEKEQDKNKHLKTIIEGYEKKIGTTFF